MTDDTLAQVRGLVALAHGGAGSRCVALIKRQLADGEADLDLVKGGRAGGGLSVCA